MIHLQKLMISNVNFSHLQADRLGHRSKSGDQNEPCDPVWKVELGEKVSFSTVLNTFLYNINNNLSQSALWPKHQNMSKCIKTYKNIS